MINYSINDIFNPKFLQQVQVFSQTQQLNLESQPAEIMKMLHAIDDLRDAYDNVSPEYKNQAKKACFLKVLSEINNGSFN